MATNAKKGSKILKDIREQADKMKMQQRFWELGGSKMGKTIGVVDAPVTDKDQGDTKPAVVSMGGDTRETEASGMTGEEKRTMLSR